jgi:hypothetical protein
MKRYLFTLWENMAQSTSARISISYYSLTRRKSPMSFESVIVKVGGSVVQISNVPTVDVHRTLRRTLTAWLLLPLFIDHAARLNPDPEPLLDSLKKARHSMKVKMSMRKLKRKSIQSLMDESITLMASLSTLLPPYRISVPYSPDFPELAMMMLLRYLELFTLLRQRQKE